MTSYFNNLTNSASATLRAIDRFGSDRDEPYSKSRSDCEVRHSRPIPLSHSGSDRLSHLAMHCGEHR
jgi:hypothetical protein